MTLELPAPEERVTAEQEMVLFRVAQESLANVHRHSGSRSASLRLSKERGWVVLEVSDVGHGFVWQCLEELAARGVGIAGMRERVRELGGRLELQSGGSGTRVHALLPLPPQTE